MALPQSSVGLSMDYSFMGSPFVLYPTKSTLDTSTLDYSFLGAPFVCNETAAISSGHIKSFNGIARANLKSINGIAFANIKSANGIVD